MDQNLDIKHLLYEERKELPTDRTFKEGLSWNVEQSRFEQNEHAYAILTMGSLFHGELEWTTMYNLSALNKSGLYAHVHRCFCSQSFWHVYCPKLPRLLRIGCYVRWVLCNPHRLLRIAHTFYRWCWSCGSSKHKASTNVLSQPSFGLLQSQAQKE